MNDKKFYKCFSYNLKNFIEIHNISHVSFGVHPTTKRDFYVYLMTPELEKILLVWSNLSRENFIEREKNKQYEINE